MEAENIGRKITLICKLEKEYWKQEKTKGEEGNNIHLDSLISPSGSDPVISMFESNWLVKESLKVISECKIGKKRVHLSPVSQDEDEPGFPGERQRGFPIPVTSTETWLAL